MARHDPIAQPLVHSTAWTDPESVHGEDVTPTPWAQPRANLEQPTTYWLASTKPDGRPHVVPLLAVMVEDGMYFCANERSKKARNLAGNAACVLTASGHTFDLVIEGEAAGLGDEAALRRVAEAYATKYGWHPEVRQGALWADGAPMAGPPPYRVYEVSAITAFGFPTDDTATPTRWRF